MKILNTGEFIDISMLGIGVLDRHVNSSIIFMIIHGGFPSSNFILGNDNGWCWLELGLQEDIGPSRDKLSGEIVVVPWQNDYNSCCFWSNVLYFLVHKCWSTSHVTYVSHEWIVSIKPGSYWFKSLLSCKSPWLGYFMRGKKEVISNPQQGFWHLGHTHARIETTIAA